jgi:hypothetical protein
VGGSLGVAIFAVVLQTQITRNIPLATKGLGSVVSTSLPLSVMEKLANAFATSFWWSFGICVIAIIPGLFLPKTQTQVPTDLETEMVID